MSFVGLEDQEFSSGTAGGAVRQKGIETLKMTFFFAWSLNIVLE